MIVHRAKLILLLVSDQAFSVEWRQFSFGQNLRWWLTLIVEVYMYDKTQFDSGSKQRWIQERLMQFRLCKHNFWSPTSVGTATSACFRYEIIDVVIVLSKLEL